MYHVYAKAVVVVVIMLTIHSWRGIINRAKAAQINE